MLEISGKARTALDAICDTFVPGEAGLPSATELGVPEAMLMAVGSSPSAAEREQFAGLCWTRWDAGRSPRSPRPSARRVLLAWADSPEVGPARRLPGAAQGHPAELLLPAAHGRGAEPGRRGARLSGAARAARRTRRRRRSRPLDDHRRHRARLRRGGGRLGRRRRHRRGRARLGRARRGGRRGGRLLQRGGLRRRRAVGLRAHVPERRRRGDRRPEHRAAGRLVPGRRHGRELHLVLPPARLRARGLEAALRAVRLGRARTSTTASTRSGSGSRSARRAASRRCATTRCATGSSSWAGTPR